MWAYDGFMHAWDEYDACQDAPHSIFTETLFNNLFGFENSKDVDWDTYENENDNEWSDWLYDEACEWTRKFSLSLNLAAKLKQFGMSHTTETLMAAYQQALDYRK